jgi:hypothetical protein
MPDNACVRSTVLRQVITEAMADVDRTGMAGKTRDEWVAIAILGSLRVIVRDRRA